MKYLTGNLIEMAQNGRFNVIVHGCNCQHVMGAGIAAQIVKVWPKVLEADKLAENELGDIIPVQVEEDLLVINAYTQNNFGRGVKNVNYGAIAKCFSKIARTYPDKRIAIPQIGAGLGGGDWNVIEEIIEFYLEVTCVKWR